MYVLFTGLWHIRDKNLTCLCCSLDGGILETRDHVCMFCSVDGGELVTRDHVCMCCLVYSCICDTWDLCVCVCMCVCVCVCVCAGGRYVVYVCCTVDSGILETMDSVFIYYSLYGGILLARDLVYSSMNCHK